MASQIDRQYTGRSRVNPMTTLLASGWGLIVAYILFTTLLSPLPVPVKLSTILSALVPLIAVWATIERKRWGRLALIGLTATAVVMFFAAAGYYMVVIRTGVAIDDRMSIMQQRLPFYDSPFTLGALLVLAVANAVWLSSPHVIAEFEYNKRPTLAVAQRAIAISLVGCWGIIMVTSMSLPQNNIGPTSPVQGIVQRSRVASRHFPKHVWRRHHAVPSF